MKALQKELLGYGLIANGPNVPQVHQIASGPIYLKSTPVPTMFRVSTELHSGFSELRSGFGRHAARPRRAA